MGVATPARHTREPTSGGGDRTRYKLQSFPRILNWNIVRIARFGSCDVERLDQRKPNGRLEFRLQK
jgi:hypothetical protein